MREAAAAGCPSWLLSWHTSSSGAGTQQTYGRQNARQHCASAHLQSGWDSDNINAFDKLSCIPDECEHTGTQQAVDWLMESDQPGSDGPSAHPLGSMDDADVSASGSLPQEFHFSASAAGVAGILRREQQQAASTDRSLCPAIVQAMSDDL